MVIVALLMEGIGGVLSVAQKRLLLVYNPPLDDVTERLFLAYNLLRENKGLFLADSPLLALHQQAH